MEVGVSTVSVCFEKATRDNCQGKRTRVKSKMNPDKTAALKALSHELETRLTCGRYTYCGVVPFGQTP